MQPRKLAVLAGAVSLALGGVVYVGVASATSSATFTPTLFSACLEAGTLYGVTGVAHSVSRTCRNGGEAVEWSSTGPAGPQGTTGPQGPAGPAGPQGASGFEGPQGPIGPQGPKGTPGVNGAPGTNGTSVLSGTTTPPTSALGATGDLYLNTTHDVLYGPKSGGVWPATGTSLIGPKGATGAEGPAGPNGPVCTAPDTSKNDLKGDDLVGCTFEQRDISTATGANLTRASLRSEPDVHLIGANLTTANLFEANLTGASLTGASLTAADLVGANLTDAVLIGANLSGAFLLNADLAGADLDGADLTYVSWLGVTCPDGEQSTTVGYTCINDLG